MKHYYVTKFVSFGNMMEILRLRIGLGLGIDFVFKKNLQKFGNIITKIYSLFILFIFSLFSFQYLRRGDHLIPTNTSGEAVRTPDVPCHGQVISNILL